MADLLGMAAMAGPPFVRAYKWATLEIRVVRVVRVALRRADYKVDSPRLRRTMYAPAFGERLAQVPRAGDELHHALAKVIEPSDATGVQLLRATLSKAFEVRLTGSTPASRFSEDRATSRYQNIMDAIERVDREPDNGSRDDTVLEYRLAGMHPMRAQEFRDLRALWPATADIVGLLSTTPDTEALLRRWVNYPPDALVGGPPELLGLISDIAADLPSADVTQLVLPFVKRALDGGIEPRPYWRLRQFVLAGVNDVDAALADLADVRGYPLVEAAVHPDGFEAAIDLLENWEAPSRREELHRRLLLVEYYQRHARLDEAIALAKETALDYDSTSAALLAVRGLMGRHMLSRNPSHRSDLSAALLLVVDTRAKRQRWGLDSGEALAAEIRVRRLLNDHQGALDIASGVGEVFASAAELRHPQMIAESALIHASHGDVEVAKRLLDSARPKDRPHIEAVIAEREGRTDDAIVHWLAAIDVNEDWTEKTDLALQLSFQGVRSSFLDELKEDNAEIAREITLIAALFGHQPGALEEARTFANAEHRGALFLYVYYLRQGDEAAAAAVAAEGGGRWSDPDMWLESARYRAHHGDHAEAVDQLRSALAVAADSWGGRRIAYRLLVEIQSAAGDWMSARTTAAQLVADEPGDSSVAWALIVCEVRTSDLPAARKTWLQAGGPEPRGEMEVAAWIELVREYGVEIGTPRDALKIAARYPESEPIRRGLIGAFLTGNVRNRQQDEHDRVDDGEQDDSADTGDDDAVGDPERHAFQELLGDYFRDFPDGGIQRVEIDLENPVRSIQELIGEPSDTAELERQIANGTLPIGFAGEAFGKTYFETLIARNSGPVFTGPPDAATETEAFEFAHERGVIVDLSALVTIARLPEALRTQLAGHFGNARVLFEHQTDATNGARSIRLDSGLSVRPGRGGEPPSFLRRDPDEVAAAAELAERVVSSFALYGTDSHPVITNIAQLADTDFNRPFMLAPDHAVASGLPVWIDDRSLVGVARVSGGHAFDTPALLRHLREEGALDAELLDLAEATLVACGYTGVMFNRAVWELAARLSTAPAGLIQAIKNGNADDLQGRARFAASLIDNHVEDPTVFAGYAHAAAQWLINVAPDRSVAANNLQLLARDLLKRPWMTSSTLPYCVEAYRATSFEDAATVLLREVYVQFEAVAEQADAHASALFAFELVSRLDPPDAFRLRAAILSRRFE